MIRILDLLLPFTNKQKGIASLFSLLVHIAHITVKATVNVAGLVAYIVDSAIVDAPDDVA